jgi:predicted PurR-regulated permease PerM
VGYGNRIPITTSPGPGRWSGGSTQPDWTWRTMTDQLSDTPSDDRDAQEREEELLREHGIDPEDPRLDHEIRRLRAGATTSQPYGKPGDPILKQSAFHTAVQAALGVVIVAALGWTVFLVRDVMLILAVALFLAIGLSPAVEYLRQHGFGPVLAPATVIVGVLLLIVATLIAGLPPLVNQGAELRDQVPQYLREGVERNAVLRDIDERVGLLERVEDVTDEAAGAAVLEEQPPARVLGLAMGVAKAVFGLVTALVLTLYFLAAYRGIKSAAYRLVPNSRRARVTLLTDEILDRIGLYVLGNLATSAVAGIAATVVLWWLDVPYPIALGLFVALMDVVPLVGATIGAVVSSAMAFTVSAGTGFAAIAFFIVYQQFENFVLVPKVMRHAIDVSPAATIVAILIGGALLGVVGALLAVPTAAAIQLIFTEVVLPRQQAA